MIIPRIVTVCEKSVDIAWMMSTVVRHEDGDEGRFDIGVSRVRHHDTFVWEIIFELQNFARCSVSVEGVLIEGIQGTELVQTCDDDHRNTVGLGCDGDVLESCVGDDTSVREDSVGSDHDLVHETHDREEGCVRDLDRVDLQGSQFHRHPMSGEAGCGFRDDDFEFPESSRFLQEGDHSPTVAEDEDSLLCMDVLIRATTDVIVGMDDTTPELIQFIQDCIPEVFCEGMLLEIRSFVLGLIQELVKTQTDVWRFFQEFFFVLDGERETALGSGQGERR